jgi:serine/threonine-protein kinase HipA
MGQSEAFVWVWLPGTSDPVVAGRLVDHGQVVGFTYGRSYLARAEAVPLYLPELPLDRGEALPLSGVVAGCIADGGPDAWGRRVIEHRRTGEPTDLGPLAYLLASGSNRVGALDFQASPERYVARTADTATLAELAEAAEAVELGVPLTPALDQALVHGSSVGGARPKAVIDHGDRQLIAKFTSTTDSYPVVKAEFIAMELARRAGLDVAPVELHSTAGRDALLVERFDRERDGTRRMVVSALTILELHDADGMAGRYATYTDLAHQIRARFSKPDANLRELFSRITWNILTGNTDDHARNHAAFWDGATLDLTPGFDICPQRRTGGEAAQAMAFGTDGDRLSQLARCIPHAGIYHLSTGEARQIIERQIEVLNEDWSEVCELAGLTAADRQRLWGRQFLNPYAVEGL